MKDFKEFLDFHPEIEDAMEAEIEALADDFVNAWIGKHPSLERQEVREALLMVLLNPDAKYYQLDDDERESWIRTSVFALAQELDDQSHITFSREFKKDALMGLLGNDGMCEECEAILSESVDNAIDKIDNDEATIINKAAKETLYSEIDYTAMKKRIRAYIAKDYAGGDIFLKKDNANISDPLVNVDIFYNSTDKKRMLPMFASVGIQNVDIGMPLMRVSLFVEEATQVGKAYNMLNKIAEDLAQVFKECQHSANKSK